MFEMIKCFAFIFIINAELYVIGINGQPKYNGISNERMLSTTDQLIEELNQNPLDPNSFSRPDLCAVTHIELNADINFYEQIIEGYVDLTVEKRNETIDHIILDTLNLTIFKISDKETDKKLDYELSPALTSFGSKLTVKLMAQKKSTIRIKYQTNAEASGLQWLEPEQTAGKLRPYLFSQCEPINCRSIIPLQDTPSVKSTYSASIRAPKDLVVLMSALHDGNGTLSSGGLTKEYKFIQNIPIPSYLIAIVVGDLVSKQIEPRSHVWSEKNLIEKSAYEFADTEKMITIAESIVGPYVWDVYDLLIPPPSFPYGGMENPCLTFVTPSLLAGDRSLVYVIAHEIAHSWTGNLVTNRNFGDLWLNEGFTTFLERKIIGRLGGGEPLRQFEAIDGYNAMKNRIITMGLNNSLTKLVVDLKGIHPEDAVSSVPYEKGHTFLFYLEQLLGGPKVFEPFMKAYIEKYKYKSIDSNEFKEFLIKYFANKSEIVSKIDWQSWLYSPGMPPITPNYDNSLAQVCTELANRWIKANDSDLNQFNANDIQSMSASQIREFLNQLLLINEKPAISKTKVQFMTEIYSLRSNNNSEIKAVWLRLGLIAHWEGCIEDSIEFVKSQGRLIYQIPIFKALYNWDETRKLAIQTYESISKQMMGITSLSVQKVLKLNHI